MSEPSALDAILQPGGISTVYQPIYRVANGRPELHGFECLSRGPKGTNFESAKVLFEYVRRKREESLVDRACIAAALEHVRLLPREARLSVNVHASTLGRDHGFVTYLNAAVASADVAWERLTVEIVEHAPPWDGVSFLAALRDVRALGAKIALDDVGLGQSNFKMLLDVAPEYLKIDRYFVDGCATDARRRTVLALLAQLAAEFEAEVIAEGVETKQDMAVLEDLGISLMQGFVFAAPMTPEALTMQSRTALVPHASPGTAHHPRGA